MEHDVLLAPGGPQGAAIAAFLKVLGESVGMCVDLYMGLAFAYGAFDHVVTSAWLGMW